MGFRIRDKSLFWTISGWKNNWQPKILNMPRMIKSNQTAYITSRYDHHSYLRMVQSYRNYSRICKQYLYGDSKAEQLLMMELRNIFRIPFTCQTPVELIKHGGERRMADQLDRDYELLSYNTHPAQLFIYELRNNYIRQQNEHAQSVEKGEDTILTAFSAELEKQAKSQEKRLGPGEKLSVEKLAEIYIRVSRVANQALQNTGARREDGEFNDFLQKRRPFVAPNPVSSTH